MQITERQIGSAMENVIFDRSQMLAPAPMAQIESSPGTEIMDLGSTPRDILIKLAEMV